VVGKAGDIYDVELGIVPTVNLLKSTGIPLTVSAPTWVTVGPATYWNKGANVCGVSFCSHDNVGVFSTGLTGKLALNWIPSRLGSWYAKAGFQYYHILNDNLLLAQVSGVGTGTASSFATAHKDVTVGFAGVGFSF
jgi:hypothetical protein